MKLKLSNIIKNINLVYSLVSHVVSVLYIFEVNIALNRYSISL